MTQAESEMRVWVPAIPLPFLGFRKRCLVCGRKFWKMDTYERHYVVQHVAAEDGVFPHRSFAQLPVSRAIDLGYGPWLMRRQKEAA